MVAANVGVTLLPTLAIKPPVARSDSIHLLRFADATPSRRIAMVWRRSSAMGDFLARVAAVFKALPEALLSAQPATEDWQAQAANEA
jgi:LysR family hydrogen peroxide-inducible transcriptional activator